MKTYLYFFTSVFFLLMCKSTHAQTGPGGVLNSTSNALWLRADLGLTTNTTAISAIAPTGTLVTNWADQSGNGNNVAQATVAQQPTYTTNVMNGMPSIWFDNVSTTNDKMIGPRAASLDGTTGYTFFMVTQPQHLDGNARAVVSKRNGVAAQESFMQFYYSSNEFFTDINTNAYRYNTSCTFSNNTNYMIDQSYNGLASPQPLNITYTNSAVATTVSNTNYTAVPVNNSPLVIASTDSLDGRPFGGCISEIIIFTTLLNNAQRWIVDNYLSAKYNIAIAAANDFYVGDLAANGSYDFDVAGVGTDATGSSTSFATSRSAGLGITQNSGFGNGDYLLAGDNTTTNYVDSVTTDVSSLPGASPARWGRVWYWDITDAGTPITVNVSFDLVNGGFPPVVPNAGPAANYELIYSSSQTFSWTVVANASSTSGTTIYFNNVSLTASGDGYYTLATTQRAASPLPIDLLSFNAIPNGEKVDIAWETATEQNNAYFTIEKSKDGINFTKLIDVPGADNSTAYKNYSETDYQPYSGTSYYRLKQTDYNNNYKYFTVVPVSFNAQQSVVVYPNPLVNSSSLNVNVNGYQNQEVVVVLRDMQGREFITKVLVSADNSHVFMINETQTLPPGTYIVTASSNNKIYNYKLIVE